METMMENYEEILQGFHENLPDTQIVLLSLTAMGGEHWGSKNQLAAYNNVTIKLLAEKYGYTFIETPVMKIQSFPNSTRDYIPIGSRPVGKIISIYAVISTEIKTLDEKFIPDTIARVADQDAIVERIDALETWHEGFEEISTEDINGLFA
jgi:hypothetical protein